MTSNISLKIKHAQELGIINPLDLFTKIVFFVKLIIFPTEKIIFNNKHALSVYFLGQNINKNGFSSQEFHKRKGNFFSKMRVITPIRG